MTFRLHEAQIEGLSAWHQAVQPTQIEKQDYVINLDLDIYLFFLLFLEQHLISYADLKTELHIF